MQRLFQIAIDIKQCNYTQNDNSVAIFDAKLKASIDNGAKLKATKILDLKQR